MRHVFRTSSELQSKMRLLNADPPITLPRALKPLIFSREPQAPPAPTQHIDVASPSTLLHRLDLLEAASSVPDQPLGEFGSRSVSPCLDHYHGHQHQENFTSPVQSSSVLHRVVVSGYESELESDTAGRKEDLQRWESDQDQDLSHSRVVWEECIHNAHAMKAGKEHAGRAPSMAWKAKTLGALEDLPLSPCYRTYTDNNTHAS